MSVDDWNWFPDPIRLEMISSTGYGILNPTLAISDIMLSGLPLIENGHSNSHSPDPRSCKHRRSRWNAHHDQTPLA